MKKQTQRFVVGSVVLILAFTLTAIFPIGGFVFAQNTTGTPTATVFPSPGPIRSLPFEPGEELVYVAEFSRALLKKMDIADFRFTASREPSLQKTVNGSSSENTVGAYSLKLTGDVSSRGFFSKLFNLHFREQIESIVEPPLFTLKKTKKIDQQGKRLRISETVYDKGKVIWTEHDPNNPSDTGRESSAIFAGQVQDLLSAIYYLRTQPLELGKTLEITVSDSGRVYQVPVRVVEKSRMKTPLGRVETLRADPEVFGLGRMIPSEGRFSIWFTNDNRRIPVSARIKNRYGTFDITLRKIQNPTSRESLAGN
jgi:Protein of unknown function (DUF3108)